MSIANAPETLAGSNANFVVTSDIPFVGDLEVVYNPVKRGGNFLNESESTSGTNTNSGLDRTITITFANDGEGNYTAPLSFSTLDDRNDNDGGFVDVTLKLNTGTPGKYTISSAQDADSGTVVVSKIPNPVLTIHSTPVSVTEGLAASVVVRASENPKRELTFKYTPTETGGTSYLKAIRQNNDDRESGELRDVSLTFTQANAW